MHVYVAQLYPELVPRVACFVSAQGPHGGSWVANDIGGTEYVVRGRRNVYETVNRKGPSRWFATTHILLLTRRRTVTHISSSFPPGKHCADFCTRAHMSSRRRDAP